MSLGGSVRVAVHASSCGDLKFLVLVEFENARLELIHRINPRQELQTNVNQYGNLFVIIFVVSFWAFFA